MQNIKNAILLIGPTATGKSNIAIDLARKEDAVIINADSIQIFKGMPILLACPPLQDKEEVPHLLYEYRDPNVNYSVGDWLRDVEKIIHSTDKNIIFVGGTGLYFSSLINGIANIPDVEDIQHQKAQNQIDEKGNKEIRNFLLNIDQKHEKIHENDKQRLHRALSVYLQTNKSIYSFYVNQEVSIPLNFVKKLIILPDREKNYQRCEERIDEMFKMGVVDEVAAFIKEYPNPVGSIKNAVGFKEIKMYLNNEIDFETLNADFKQRTRNYIKRQTTWINGHFSDWEYITINGQ